MKTIEMYQKPQVIFIDTKSTHALADKCWGNHGNSVQYRYEDPDGNGYVIFTIEGKGCKWNPNIIGVYPTSPEAEKVLRENFNSGGMSEPVKSPPFYINGGGSN